MVALAGLPQLYRIYYWHSSEQRLISIHYHREITKAIDAQDADRADSLMRAHLNESRDYLVGRLNRAELDDDDPSREADSSRRERFS
jgi:DNA-binding GntR family transcriptional regulator